MVEALWRRKYFLGFFNPEVAVGYWSRNVLVEGLGGKTFLVWGCFIFLLCAITLGIKAKITSSCGRLGSQLPSSHIDLDFISRPSPGTAQLVSELGKVGNLGW